MAEHAFIDYVKISAGTAGADIDPASGRVTYSSPNYDWAVIGWIKNDTVALTHEAFSIWVDPVSVLGINTRDFATWQVYDPEQLLVSIATSGANLLEAWPQTARPAASTLADFTPLRTAGTAWIVDLPVLFPGWYTAGESQGTLITFKVRKL